MFNICFILNFLIIAVMKISILVFGYHVALKMVPKPRRSMLIFIIRCMVQLIQCLSEMGSFCLYFNGHVLYNIKNYILHMTRIEFFYPSIIS